MKKYFDTSTFSLERSIIIFLWGVIFSVICSFLLRVWPFIIPLSFLGAPAVTPVGTHTPTSIALKLAHIPQKISFTSTEATQEIDKDTASYVVVDRDTKQIIGAQNMDKQVSIASVTKIMTAIVALDLASPEERFVVSEKAARQIPTKIGVVTGEHMTNTELLHALLLTSANDAADVIKEGIDTIYGDNTFMMAMNTKAALLNMRNSHFSNPQGFDSRHHYSTAYDLAILTEYALENYPLIEEIVGKTYTYLPANSAHKQFDLHNWNGLLGVYPGVSGVKIGNTGKAGRTTIVTSRREGKNLLAVVLGTKSILDRDLITAELLDWGFKTAYQLPEIGVTENVLREKYATWQTNPRDISQVLR